MFAKRSSTALLFIYTGMRIAQCVWSAPLDVFIFVVFRKSRQLSTLYEVLKKIGSQTHISMLVLDIPDIVWPAISFLLDNGAVKVSKAGFHLKIKFRTHFKIHCCSEESEMLVLWHLCYQGLGGSPWKQHVMTINSQWMGGHCTSKCIENFKDVSVQKALLPLKMFKMDDPSPNNIDWNGIFPHFPLWQKPCLLYFRYNPVFDLILPEYYSSDHERQRC
jgi:hypothetical protein